MVSRLCGRQRVPSAQLGLGTMKGSAHTGRGDLVTKRDKEVTRYQSAFICMVINVSIFLRANVLSPLPPPPPPPKKGKNLQHRHLTRKFELFGACHNHFLDKANSDIFPDNRDFANQ